MARYKSSVEIQGSIGDLVYYQLNGIPVVRRKSGFNKKSFKEKESYQKVRENSSEFGQCSKAGKLVREALHELVPYAEDKYFYQKVAKLMTEIKDLDQSSERGKRNVPEGLKGLKAKEVLRNFQWGEMPKVHPKIHIEKDLFSSTLFLPKLAKGQVLELITIHLDLSVYEFEIESEEFSLEKSQAIALSESKTSIEVDATLYFAGVKNKDMNYLQMGFLG